MRRNADVTIAILDAERHDQVGAYLWDRVAEFEQAIADDPAAPETEREIARRGVVTARERARFLRGDEVLP